MSKIITAIILANALSLVAVERELEALKAQTETRFGHLPKWARNYKVSQLIHFNHVNDIELSFLYMEVCKMDHRAVKHQRLVRDYNCALFFRQGLEDIAFRNDL